MSTDISAIIERARAAATQRPGDAPHGASERARLEKVAQEFESMLLTQMLRDMRTSGQWEEEDSQNTLGADTMFETLDVELAGHLARVQGLGLSKQLLEAFDRMQGSGITRQAAESVEAPAIPPQGPIAAPVHEIVPSPANLSVTPQAALVPQPTVAPVEGKVTSSFGWRHDPFTGQAKFHKGIDLRAAYGQDVKAAGEGRVVFSGTQGGYGTTVVVEHADGTRTRYAHLSVALVGAGDRVGAGQPIGQAGRSGRATGTHLHFEVIAPSGKPVDPQAARLLAMRVTGQEESSGG